MKRSFALLFFIFLAALVNVHSAHAYWGYGYGYAMPTWSSPFYYPYSNPYSYSMQPGFFGYAGLGMSPQMPYGTYPNAYPGYGWSNGFSYGAMPPYYSDYGYGYDNDWSYDSSYTSTYSPRYESIRDSNYRNQDRGYSPPPGRSQPRAGNAERPDQAAPEIRTQSDEAPPSATPPPAPPIPQSLQEAPQVPETPKDLRPRGEAPQRTTTPPPPPPQLPETDEPPVPSEVPPEIGRVIPGRNRNQDDSQLRPRPRPSPVPTPTIDVAPETRPMPRPTPTPESGISSSLRPKPRPQRDDENTMAGVCVDCTRPPAQPTLEALPIPDETDSQRPGVGERQPADPPTTMGVKARNPHERKAQQAPIWNAFITAFQKCEPGCEPAQYAAYGARPSKKSCHWKGEAIDLGAMICDGKTYRSIDRGRFATMVKCMKNQGMKTLYFNGPSKTSGHRDHAHFSKGCNNGTYY